MIARLRQWLEETHSDTFELVRHFLARFFDNEIGASAGDWQKVAIGIFATLVSLGTPRLTGLPGPLPNPPGRRLFHARNSTRRRCARISSACSPSPWRVTALLTLLQWQSLFPSLRDYMALTGFPVSARQIFAAKFGALVLVFVAYVLSLTGPLAGFFGWVIRGNWQENPSGTFLTAATFAALAGACTFVFFALLALQGVLLNLVPGRWFLRVSLFVQATLFIAIVGALPALRTTAAERRMVASGLVPAALGSHGYRTSIGAPRPPRHRSARAARGTRLSAQLPPLPQAAAGGPSGSLRRALVRMGFAPPGTVDPQSRANRPPLLLPGRRSRVAPFTGCCSSPTPASPSAG